MTHRALKRRRRWLQPPDPQALRGPLPWLIIAALALLLSGVGGIARLALHVASPTTTRYSGELGARSGADYSFWAFGPLIPPINPEVIEASEADTNLPPPEPGLPAPPADLPIAVVAAATASPTAAPVEPSPTPEPPSPTPSPTATTPPPTAAPPTAVATRTSVPQQAPSVLPTSTRQPTATAQPPPPTSTPVSAPPAPPAPPTSTPPPPTSTPPPATATATRTPAPPVAPPTSTPTQGPPTSTPVPPSPTPEPPPVLSFTGASPIVAEEAGEVVIELLLNKPATQQVSVAFATSGGGAAPGLDYVETSGTVVFNRGEQTRSLRVPVLRDGLNEAPELFTITLSEARNAVLDAVTSVSVTILDSNAPPLVRFTGDVRSVPEGGNSVALTIQLSEVSALDVTVPFVVQGSAEQADHTLRAGTAIIPAGQTSVRLRFSIVNDRIDEEDERIEVRLRTPTNAQLGAPSLYTITIGDDDTAAVIVDPIALRLAEGGAAASYGVRLDSQPLFPVTIALQTADGQLQTSPASLTFTAENWASEQRVSVSAVDDLVDETPPGNNSATHVGLIAHSAASLDPRYERITVAPVTATIIDNDTAGIFVDPISLSVAEGGATASYSVRLTSQPTGPVQIGLAPGGELSVSPASLSFTTANWGVAQTVTVTAVDDAVDEDGDNNMTPHAGRITHSVTSSDPSFAALAISPVTAAIADNDSAGVIIAPLALSLAEGAPGAAYTVRLRSQPVAPVTVALIADAELGVNRFGLDFTPADWNIPQVVTVTAADDSTDEDGDGNVTRHRGTVLHSSTSADPHYDDSSRSFNIASVRATITDNDTAALLVTPEALRVSEGGTITYSVRLGSRPRAAVQVTIAAGPPSLVVLETTSLSFAPATWDQPQTVTVRALDNQIDAPDAIATLSHGLASGDPFYNGLAVAPLAVTVADDDVAGVLIAPEALELAEGEAGQAYAVRLTSEPLAPVQIALNPDAQLEVAPTTLTFTPANWNLAQAAVVTAIDDLVDEDGDNNASPHAGAVAHSVTSADATYQGLAAPALEATIADNDTAALLIEPAAIAVSELLSAPDHSITYTVRLASQPTQPVTIALTFDALQLQVAPATLSFTGEDWDELQVVTVTAVDDALLEPAPQASVIDHASTSADPAYAALPPAQLAVTVADDDQAALEIGPITLNVSEVNASATLSGGNLQLQLRSAPTAPVTVTLILDEQLTASETSLVFTGANWSVPQELVLAAIDDMIAEAPIHTGTISFSLSSADPLYNGRVVVPYEVAIEDDE